MTGAWRAGAASPIPVACFAVFVFAVSGPGDAPTSGVEGLGRVAWLAADVVTASAFLAGGGRLWSMLAQNPWLAAWPALAVGSALWSLAPGMSVYHGLQLLMTIMVGYLGLSTLGLRRLVLSLVVGLALGEAASLIAILRHVDGSIGNDGTWIGAYTHKNVLGSAMALQIMSCGVLVLDGRHRRTAWVALAPAVVLLLGSRSGTSAASLSIVLACAALALAWRRGPVAFGMTVGLLVVLLGVLLGVALGGGHLGSMLLSGLGKDDTLTGRTVLWRFGLDQIRAAPILGIGYKAYWESATTSSAYLRYVIGQDLWFFHNNAIDVTVAFGLLGLSIFAATLIGSLRRCLAMFAADARPLVLWRLLFVVYVIVEASAEDPLFQNHSLQQLLLAVATAWPQASRAPARGGRPVPTAHLCGARA